MGKSIVAVVVGFVIVAALSTVTDGVMHATGIFPPWGQPMSSALFALALGYRTIFTVLGGLVTARLAPQNKMKHVRVLAALGVVGGGLGVLAWSAAPAASAPAMGPLWYPLAILVLAVPSVWVGGLLGLRAAPPIAR